MASTRTAPIGQGSANYVLPHAIITVKSTVNYGDATTGGGGNFDPTSAQLVPWGITGTNNFRLIPLYHIDLAILPTQIQVARAILHIGIVYRALAVISSPITLALHEIEGVLATGTTYLLRATGVPWYASGNGPAPGFDYDATPVGSRVLTTTEIAALPTSVGFGVVAMFADIDVTDALQRARDAKRNLDLILPVTVPAQGASDQLLNFDYPAGALFSAKPHTYLSVEYWPAIGVLSAASALAGRPADFTKLHDPAAAGTNNRTWLDTVEDGTTGSPVKEWAWNFRRSGIRRDVVVGTGRAESTNVNNSGAAGSRTLRAVRVYDNATGFGSDTGAYVIEPQSTSTYKLAFTNEAGTTAYLNDKITGLPTVDFATNHTFRDAANTKDVLTIETARFSVTTGWLTTDRVRWNVRADQRTTQSVDTPSLVEVMPPTTPLGDTGSTSRARKVSGAYTQQGWAAATNVTISAVSRGHLTVRDTLHTGWLPGGCVTVFTTGGVLVTEDLTISAVDPPGYTDTLRLNRDFTAPEIAAFANASWKVTGGVYLGTMAASAIRQLAAAIGVGATTLTLNTGFEGGTPGEVWLVDTLTGANEVISVDSGLVTLDLTGATVNAYSQGSLAFLVVDPLVDPADLAGEPYFVQGDIPTGQAEGLYSGMYDIFECKTV